MIQAMSGVNSECVSINKLSCYCVVRQHCFFSSFELRFIKL